MDPVEETLISTQNLLCALEQDKTLLADQNFMSRLTFLRGKHKETTDLLQHQTQPQPKNGPSGATYHKSPGCNHFWSEIVPKNIQNCQESKHRSFRTTERFTTKTVNQSSYAMTLSKLSCGSQYRRELREERGENIRIQSTSTPIAQDAVDVLKRMGSAHVSRSHVKTNPYPLQKETQRRPSSSSKKINRGRNGSVETHVVEEDDILSRERSVSTAESRTNEVKKDPIAQNSSKHRATKKLPTSKPIGIKSASIQDLRSVEKEPKVTVPKPFTFNDRKYKGNTYAQKFLKQMLDEKEQKEKELADEEVSGIPFKAHPVPSSTYKSTNPRVEDQRYADAIRKKLQANLRLQTTLIRSKSMGDVSATQVRPVPASTYVAPVLPSYRRERSASRRAVQLLTEAQTPPGLREHSVRTNLAFHLRHQHCRENPDEGRVRRPSVPDFNRLHREFYEKLQRGMSAKPPTVPVPFHLSENSQHRHRQCRSTSPPKTMSHHPSPVKHPSFPVQTTHSAALRAEAIKKKLDEEKKSKNRWNSESEERRAELAVQRQRLLRSMSGSRAKELDKIVDQRRQAMKETTREYEKELSDMKKRVMARPLIMEMQTVHGQQNKLEKKFTEAMTSVSTKTTKAEESNFDDESFVVPSLPSHLLLRRSSGGTGDTFSVKSKGSDKEDYKMEFDTDEDRKSTTKRSSSRTSKSSKSSSKSRLNSSNGSSSISSSGSNGSTSRSSNSSK